jgi:hypothetical protein
VLAELALIDFDQIMSQRYNFVRYVDDIAVICESRSEAAEALHFLESELRTRGLLMSRAKTAVESHAGGIRWLGIEHYEERARLEDRRAEKWIAFFAALRYRHITQICKANNDAERQFLVEEFHRELRRELTGKGFSRPAWLAFVTDSHQLSQIDRALHGMIRSVHRTARISPPVGRQLPSITRLAKARFCRLSSSTPSNAD